MRFTQLYGSLVSITSEFSAERFDVRVFTPLVAVFVRCRPLLLTTVSPIDIITYCFATTETDSPSVFMPVSTNYLRLRISTEPYCSILRLTASKKIYRVRGRVPRG